MPRTERIDERMKKNNSGSQLKKGKTKEEKKGQWKPKTQKMDKRKRR